jgi:hypothetical protein
MKLSIAGITPSKMMQSQYTQPNKMSNMLERLHSIAIEIKIRADLLQS